MNFKVLHVDQYNMLSQAHGRANLMLQETWACHTHLGEHREPGVCWVPEGGGIEGHIGCGNLRCRVWTAAIVCPIAEQPLIILTIL